MQGAAGAVAKVAGEIAAVGDLNIDAAAHGRVPSPELCVEFILSYFGVDEKGEEMGTGSNTKGKKKERHPLKKCCSFYI